MKRRDLIQLLELQGCKLLREGRRHTVYFNPTTKQTSTIPRHKEVDDFLAKKICKDLGVSLKK
ncbi:MAG: type II toxin-antitoxin system HicA family toxin [Bacteroidota bacterium]|nr:type II toxin-antitoxin system HicA family toxin [Bacteroidota bacterium]MDP4229573.1 type II toxin-antitoxin system HicA family toxin [Bacteroidota bacterium]MDP4237742.1 type II toxin-antitoxin system HicA family toxin [Bacteroidota bacterium]